MDTQEPDNRNREMVRLERPKPVVFWVPTLDAKPKLKPDDGFDFERRNREILVLMLVVAVVWWQASLLNSSYKEIESLNVTISEKEKVIATLPTADAIVEKLRDELKPKAAPQDEKKEPQKVRQPKRKSKLTGQANDLHAAPLLPTALDLLPMIKERN
jgi:cell division protein FtsB